MTFITPIASALKQLQDKPVLYPLVKEVGGCNAPKTLMARNKNEMFDVATGQFGGTICFFSSGILLDKLLKPLYDKVLKTSGKVPVSKAAMEWSRLGKSASIYAIQGALYWAVPFFRNYLTAKRSGTHDFVQMVGAEKKTSQASQHRLQHKLKQNMDMVYKIVAGGAAVSALSVLGTILAIKKKMPLPSVAKFFLKHLGLGGGSFKNYPRWAEFFFIAVASYVGWIHATRDKYELKEQLLQFGTFLFGWFIPPLAFERIYKGKLKTLLNNKALFDKVIGVNSQGKANSMLSIGNIRKHLASTPKLKTAAEKLFVSQTLLSLGFSIVMLSVLPQLLNIYLTKRRVQKRKLLVELAQQRNPVASKVQSPFQPGYSSSLSKPVIQH